jgi:hypothetical protein
MARHPGDWVPGHLAPISPGLTAGDMRAGGRIIPGRQGSGSISTFGFMARIGPGRALTTGQPRSAAR